MLQEVTLSSAGMEAHNLSMLPATTPGAAMLNGTINGFHSDSHFRGGTKWSRNRNQKVYCFQGRLLCLLVQTYPEASTNEPNKGCTSILQIFSLVWRIYGAPESCSQTLLTIPRATSRPHHSCHFTMFYLAQWRNYNSFL